LLDALFIVCSAGALICVLACIVAQMDVYSQQDAGCAESGDYGGYVCKDRKDFAHGCLWLEGGKGGFWGLTLALSGTQHWPRSGIPLLRVREEQLVKHHVLSCLN